MAIKTALGKLTLAQPVSSFVNSQIAQYQFLHLTITLDHTYQIESLPLYHSDPFDRLLIVQAMLEGLVILTRDPQFPQYGVSTIW